MALRIEVPGGLINGVNTTFTTPVAYVAASLSVWYRGVLLRPEDVSELTSSSFSLSFAPESGAYLYCGFDDGAGGGGPIVVQAAAIVVYVGDTALANQNDFNRRVILLVTGDGAPRLDFAFKTTDGDPYNFTTSSVVSVYVKFRMAGRQRILNPAIPDQEATIDSAAGGTCHFIIPPAVLTTAGRLEAQIQLIYTGAVVWTVPDILRFQVRRAFGA